MEQEKLLRLAEELKASGQAGEFMEMLNLLDGLHNCTVIPTKREGADGTLYSRQIDLSEKGKSHFGHPHSFTHSTLIAQGKALIEIWDGD